MIGEVWSSRNGWLTFVVARETPDRAGRDVWDCLILDCREMPDLEGTLQQCSGSGIKARFERIT